MIFYVPLEIAVTPTEGHCYVNRWWAVNPEAGLAFYISRPTTYIEDPAPQCNHNIAVIKRSTIPGIKPVFIPVVYYQHAIRKLKEMQKDYDAQTKNYIR